MTILVTDNKRHLEKIARIIYHSLIENDKKAANLHASHETPATRKKLLKLLNKTDTTIFSIFIEKKKIHKKVPKDKAFLYNHLTSILLGQVFTRKETSLNDSFTLIASQRETTNFLNKNFKNYVTSKLKDAYNIDIKVEIATPTEEKSLQVVDFASWAIHRKYEFGDTSYYDRISTKIVNETSFM